MTKNTLIGLLRAYGEAVILTHLELKSKDETAGAVVTTDFNTPYIKAFQRRKFNKSGVLVFSWTENKFITVDPHSIVKVIPLSDILKNNVEHEIVARIS